MTKPSESIRAFVALDIGESARLSLQEIVEVSKGVAKAHGAHGTWAREPHLTLAFLGRVPTPDLPGIAGQLRLACAPAGTINLELRGIGAFPTRSRPRVIWVGIRGELQALAALQTSIAEAMRVAGSHLEQGPYSPHITLCRIKNCPGGLALMGALDDEHDGMSIQCRCQRVLLMQSHLSPKGARYSMLESVTLEE